MPIAVKDIKQVYVDQGYGQSKPLQTNGNTPVFYEILNSTWQTGIILGLECSLKEFTTLAA